MKLFKRKRIRMKKVIIVLCIMITYIFYTNLQIHLINNHTQQMIEQLNKLETQLNQLQTINIKLTDTLSQSDNQITTLTDEISQTNSKIKKCINQINDLNETIANQTNWLIPTVVVGVCTQDAYTKTYMDYRSITSKSSNQYKLLHSDIMEYCDDGLIRTKEGQYIAVALGSQYGSIGTKYIMKLSSGKEVRIIKAEEKADKDTVNGCIDKNGAMVEFVIDIEKAKSSYKYAIYTGSFNYSDEFNGKIVEMKKVIE